MKQHKSLNDFALWLATTVAVLIFFAWLKACDILDTIEEAVWREPA